MATPALRLVRALILGLFCFFFNDTATTEIYTLSLHDALPISASTKNAGPANTSCLLCSRNTWQTSWQRSEEHTSELQSLTNLVCRLLLEKKKKTRSNRATRRTSCGQSQYDYTKYTHSTPGRRD